MTIIGNQSKWYSPLLLAIVVILSLIPFADKAFHIDDTLFLEAARQIQARPLDFYGFSINWYGTEIPMAEVTRNPPLTSYYIAALAWLFGFHEIPLHIGFLLPAVTAALGTFYLAKQFCSNPLIAALCAVLMPAFLVSSTDLMCDIMMLAFWVWALFFWIEGLKTKKMWLLLLAAILITLAALTKYFGIALVPLLFVYSLIQEQRLGRWMIYLLPAVVGVILYQVLTNVLYNKNLLADAGAFVIRVESANTSLSSPLSSILTVLVFTGGCMLPILFFSPLLWSRKTLIVGTIAIIFWTLVLYFCQSVGGKTIRDSQGIRWELICTHAIMAIGGVSLLGLVWAEFWQNKTGQTFLLLLWVLGTFLFASVVNWTISARSLLPMAPAVGILIALRLEKKIPSRQFKLRHFAPLLPAAIIALAAVWADYTLANTARTAAEIIHKDFSPTQKRIWFQGHWGFQFYMQTYGCQPLDFKKAHLQSGDIVITPSNNTGLMSIPDQYVLLKKTLNLTPCRWLATMQPIVGAGFYSSVWGPVPFLFGKIPPENYCILEVKCNLSWKGQSQITITE
jgi:4-amino-4-deoxy-L-arabinose transferase-like glycosyltransferase